MAELIVNILDPADVIDFLSIEEAKLLLGLPGGDASQDEALKLQISIASATIAQLCNRTFARERVSETWRKLGAARLFLTHFPVEQDDIEAVEAGGGALAPDAYELEEQSGKLLGLGRLAEPVRITYTGGFELPDEAPLPLKQATILLLVHARSQATRESIEGIRMISHKESRVMFFDPSQQQAKGGPAAGALGSGVKQVDDLLMHYVKLWA
jgi:hypothetical protein